jgi:uncharacterized protein YigE (DUF2233 family)
MIAPVLRLALSAFAVKVAPRRRKPAMSRAILILLLATGLAGPAAAGCEPVAEQGRDYVVCTFDAARDAIRLFWKSPDGQPYGGPTGVATALKAAGQTLRFGMNAGMYEADLSPVGLYVEDGRQLRGANMRNGSGNFHLKPNGVFYVGQGRAGVLETGRYLARKPAVSFATQSGPMLVAENRIHPKINATGTSEKIRNGVGVRDGGRTVIFAISRQPVTFHAFASLFRDRLKAPDALFLDGSVSTLYAPNASVGGLVPVGPIIGVTEKPKEAGR